MRLLVKLCYKAKCNFGIEENKKDKRESHRRRPFIIWESSNTSYVLTSLWPPGPCPQRPASETKCFSDVWVTAILSLFWVTENVSWGMSLAYDDISRSLSCDDITISIRHCKEFCCLWDIFSILIYAQSRRGLFGTHKSSKWMSAKTVYRSERISKQDNVSLDFLRENWWGQR